METATVITWTVIDTCIAGLLIYMFLRMEKRKQLELDIISNMFYHQYNREMALRGIDQ